MTRLFALTLWTLAFIAALFTLATDVWAGMVPIWQFVGATLLGVIYPLGTWAIVKHYPETDWFAWRFMAMIGCLIAGFALFRFVASL
jgi:hypothetical protein